MEGLALLPRLAHIPKTNPIALSFIVSCTLPLPHLERDTSERLSHAFHCVNHPRYECSCLSTLPRRGSKLPLHRRSLQQ